MLPVIELRGGLPYGLVVFHMNIVEAFIWSVLGNIMPVFFLLKLLDPVVKWIFKHSPYLEKHVKQYFEKLHHKHSAKFNDLGALFLATFVAIPIPGTGAWTGALLAYLFNIPFKLAFGAITLGVVGAGIIVALASESAIGIFSLFS